MTSVQPETSERELVTAFAEFGPAYRRWIESHARGDGMTFPRMRLLKVLQLRGPSIMRELGDELCVTARGVTSLVDGLESEGMVRRRQHPTDRRATVVELTDDGRAALQERFERYASEAATLFTTLDPDDQRALLRIIHALIAALPES
jgi:DNA-binding MarR family transcriptional regulator